MHHHYFINSSLRHSPMDCHGTVQASGGVSRSGRVRKKPAKLMEMELSMHDDRYLSPVESRSSAIPSSVYVSHKTAALGSALMGASSPLLHDGPISPQLSPTSPLMRGLQVRQIPVTPPPVTMRQLPAMMPVVNRVHPPTLTSMPSRANTVDTGFPRTVSDDHQEQNPRVIAIKSIDTSPSFENLSGSTYLIGDDVHFITGEPIDSDPEVDDANDDDDHHGYRGLSPLKVDIGGHVIDEDVVGAEHSTVSAASFNHVDDGDGLRFKFILSPSSVDKGKGGQSKPKKSKKSSKSHSKKSGSSDRNSSKSKKKKKKGKSADNDRSTPPHPDLYRTHDSFRGMPVLEDVAAGRMLPGSFDVDSDSDDIDDESKLIIAEPPVLQPMVPIGKSKKKSGGSSSKSKKSKSEDTVGTSSSKFVDEQQNILNDGRCEFPVTPEILGQQHSVYLKEKNTSKKKSGKKTAKAKDKGPGHKTRPMSAYMLWSREYRSHIVRQNPGIEFAAISRRLGEVWQSLSEFEKTLWRRKAKMSSCKPSTTGTSNVINTGKKRSEPSIARSNSGKTLYKGTPTVVTSPVRSSDDNSVGLKPVGTTPLDVAAHLKLLGESLSIIGQRLTEHEGQIAVSGSLSVLLDSTLCALGPLLCLTSEVDQLNGCSQATHERILDNIAYIMPGL